MKTPNKAWKLLSRKGAWTKHSYARDRRGREIGLHDDSAVKFCAMGAIRRVYPEGYASVEEVVKRHMNGRTIWFWNDSSSDKRRIVKLLKKLNV